jgi:GT2 family glycosyltransferase
MRLSVVVVNWNLRDELEACLESLRAQTHRDLETVVVDNGSTDGSASLVETKFSECTVLRQAENLGFAEGCNRGIAACTGEWVAMLNNDAVADPGWAAALVRRANAGTPTCGMLQSLMLFKQRPETINSTGIELGPDGGGRDRHESMPRASSSTEEEIFCCTAGAAAYRRTMLEEVKLSSGYFDRDHFMYSEDLDLGWRARLAGWSAVYVPDAVVFHRYHASSDRHGPAWLATMGRVNRIRTVLKNASWRFLARTIPRMVATFAEVLWYGRGRGPAMLLRALHGGLASRAQVTALCREPRHRVEARWMARR